MNSEITLPKISIVIPMYNASKDIEECLNSIFDSEYKEFEVILVDDCSIDDTLQKVSSYSCTIIKNQFNRGPAHSRNQGADVARAEIILFLDSDILISSKTLIKIEELFEKNTNVSVLQGRYEDTPYYNNLFSQYKHYIFSFRGLASGNTYVNFIHTACVAMRKEVFYTVRFNENLRRREDIDFGLRCVENKFLIYADSELTVRHKKKYDLISFSKYQFSSGKELVLQNLVTKSKNIIQEFNSSNQPLYKKLWLLRPILPLFILLILICLMIRCEMIIFLNLNIKNSK